MLKELDEKITQQTMNLWSKRSGQDISFEDVREMIKNIAGFFTMLMEYDRHANQNNNGREINLEPP